MRRKLRPTRSSTQQIGHGEGTGDGDGHGEGNGHGNGHGIGYGDGDGRGIGYGYGGLATVTGTKIARGRLAYSNAVQCLSIDPGGLGFRTWQHRSTF